MIPKYSDSFHNLTDKQLTSIGYLFKCVQAIRFANYDKGIFYIDSARSFILCTLHEYVRIFIDKDNTFLMAFAIPKCVFWQSTDKITLQIVYCILRHPLMLSTDENKYYFNVIDCVRIISSKIIANVRAFECVYIFDLLN